MELTREQAIAEHRKMWNWIAEETLNKERCFEKIAYFRKHNIIEIPIHCCYCCAFAYDEVMAHNNVFEEKISIASDIHGRCQFCPVIWINEYSYINDQKQTCISSDSSLYERYLWACRLNNYELASKLALEIANLPERRFEEDEK